MPKLTKEELNENKRLSAISNLTSCLSDLDSQRKRANDWFDSREDQVRQAVLHHERRGA